MFEYPPVACILKLLHRYRCLGEFAAVLAGTDSATQRASYSRHILCATGNKGRASRRCGTMAVAYMRWEQS